MGFNTGVLILNDAIHGIQNDPQQFANNFMLACANFQRANDVVDFRIGNHVNGGTVFHLAHADMTGVYAIGGNHTTRLSIGNNGGRHHTIEDKVQLLKKLADEMGFAVVKKRTKKNDPWQNESQP